MFVSRKIHVLTLSYSSKIKRYLHHQMVFPPLKKTLWYVIRGQCCPSSRVWQPSAGSNGSFEPFLFTFWVGPDSPLLTIRVHQKAIAICRGLSHPTRSLSRIVCRGQERSKGRKGTLRPDFQGNTRPSIFFKKPMSLHDTGRQLWGNLGIIRLRQFRDNEAWIQLGQESPLMN
jgi:hypothetical protein